MVSLYRCINILGRVLVSSDGDLIDALFASQIPEKQ